METTWLEITLFITAYAIFGALLGSFTCCQVRRMRRKEKGQKPLGKWSVCEHCKHKLTPGENIPIISWLVQKGRCKKCKAKIGCAEIISEAGLMVIFAILGYVFYRDYWHGTLLRQIILGNTPSTTINWLSLLAPLVAWLLTLIAVTLMWMIVIYDAKWSKMPTKLLVATAIAANLTRIIVLAQNGFSQSELVSLAGALAFLPLLYFLLYICSHEALVGSGDWLLALSIALLLGNWWLAFFELFLSNAIASVVAVSIILRDRPKKNFSLKIPFGPYLVIAFSLITLFYPIIENLVVF